MAFPLLSLSRKQYRFLFAALIVVELFVLRARYDPAGFGVPHDDTLYFSSAQALARGEGYVLPSLPGAPAQTKYPILYSWLLSLVWRIWPEFPANLAPAFWLNALFGCAALAAAVVVLRQLGASRGAALFLGALFGLHPYTVLWTNFLLSDAPFTAMSLGAMALAHRALSREAQDRAALWEWVGCVALLWLAVLTRSLGVTVAGGIAATALLRRRPGAAIWAASACLPVAAGALESIWSAKAAAVPAGGSGFVQTWLAYTDYAAYWKLCTPDWTTFRAQARFNLFELLKHPAGVCFLLPAAGIGPLGTRLLAVAVSAGVIKGIVGEARRKGAHPIHFALLFYAPIMVAWNFVLLFRFLLLFVPLFFFGAWSEFSTLLRVCLRKIRARGETAERVVSAAIVCALAALTVFASYEFFWSTPRGLDSVIRRRASNEPARIEAYEWIRRNTAPEDRLISYDDAILYLRTGRQAMRPMAISTAAFYLQSKQILDRDLERIAHTARSIGARYWMTTGDDYTLEGAEKQIRKAVSELLDPQPVAFESSDGRVRIYDIQGLLESTK